MSWLKLLTPEIAALTLFKLNQSGRISNFAKVFKIYVMVKNVGENETFIRGSIVIICIRLMSCHMLLIEPPNINETIKFNPKVPPITFFPYSAKACTLAARLELPCWG
jgi:hypothetical protein